MHFKKVSSQITRDFIHLEHAYHILLDLSLIDSAEGRASHKNGIDTIKYFLNTWDILKNENGIASVVVGNSWDASTTYQLIAWCTLGADWVGILEAYLWVSIL
jgi:hypothetical protein